MTEPSYRDAYDRNRATDGAPGGCPVPSGTIENPTRAVQESVRDLLAAWKEGQAP